MATDDDNPEITAADVSLFAFALSDCVIEIEPKSAKYLRAVHRTALELAVPNLFGPYIGGYWLTPTQLEQLRLLPECYPSNESRFVRQAVESYVAAQSVKVQEFAQRRPAGPAVNSHGRKAVDRFESD